MTQDSIILEGKKMNELIEAGLERLCKTEDEVDIDVLEKGRNIGNLNIKKYKIKITVKSEYTSNSKDLKKTNDILDKIDRKNNLVPFKIIYESDGVYLSVNVSEELDIVSKDIMEKIDQKKIKDIDYVKLKEVFKNNKSVNIKIAPAQEEKLIDSTIDIEVSEDNMKGYMTIHSSDGGHELSLEEVMRSLRDEIKCGIDEGAVRSTIEEKKYNRKILIASGCPSVDGKDGFIEYKFEENKGVSPYILDDGSVDFRKLNLISNINKDDVLAVLHPPEVGQDGYNLLGDIIDHKTGNAKNFKYGKNVGVSEDGLKLISLSDGQVSNVNEKVTVYELYTVNKDVDNSTGDIDFKGSVSIQGNVLTGFKITAKGNIEIEGVVEGAVIECGGDLVIKRGIQGYNMAKISTEGTMITKYIENAKVTCGGNIDSEAIMHSETVSGGTVTVKGKKGLLVGGSCKSAKEINAKIIGSHMATATLLEVGLDPRIREEQEHLKKSLDETELDVDKFSKMINHLSRINREENLSEDKKELLDKSIVAKLQLEKKVNELYQQIRDIDEKIKNSSRGRINVEGTIYSGVKVIIGNSSTTIDEPKDRCTIYRDKEDFEIKIGPFTG